MFRAKLRVFSLVIGIFLVLSLFSWAQFDPGIFHGLKARNIGPANMSGRIAAVEVDPTNPKIIYVGAATGGVWKSEDGGLTWRPIFDDQPTSSIGAIAVHPQNPNIVWVGTGESGVRNTAGVGRGVFLSLNGGQNWQWVGLEKTEHISRILLDPNNPDVAYVAALGTAWGENKERGVFKTEDRGKTWKKILYVDEKTGAADMAMAPDNPLKIIVAMWQFRRWPWFFKSGGPGSGLYITEDGGKTWRKLTAEDGLPAGELGRIGIAFAPSNPRVVYAIVEASKSALFRSDDGGFTWRMVNNEENIHSRPFYYSGIKVNPKNENIVYLVQSQLRVSEDGGRTFRPLASFRQAHSDYHALWIHPDGEYLVVGNDGGVVISYNGGQTWRYVANLPLGQYYHVSFDNQIPYNVYGGLQDNGSWVGPAYVLKERGLYNYFWKTVGGGDGFDVEPDPEKPGAGYGMSQGGNLYYFDMTTGTSINIVPTESEVKHRYNWNAGFAVDPFEPATIYLGSQFVHRSRDKGRTWEIISPDLTTNNPEKQRQAESGGLTLDVTNAENHCTIICIAPSPVQKGVIWVGTDDGNVQLTRDGGQTWELVSKKLTVGGKGKVPPETWVSHVEASKFDAATAYVCFDDHRRANWTPYVYVTHDFGRTWQSLVTPEIDGFVHVIEEDTVNPNLLFLGTEFGLYVSFNGGQSWMKWTQGVPTVPVRDLAVHPRENDLIIATHGRSLFIIDDISPLRELSAALLKKKLHLFKVPEAYQFIRGGLSSYLSPGDTAFTGENKRFGACFTYYLLPSKKKGQEKKDPQAANRRALMERMRQAGMMGQRAARMMAMRSTSSRVKIIIENKEGQVIAQLNGPEEKGINRVYWNFQEQLPAQDEQSTRGRFGRGGVTVLPGEYTVRIKYEGQEVSQTFQVKTDPRFTIDLKVLQENYKMAKEAQKLSLALNKARQRIKETQEALKTIATALRQQRSPQMKELMQATRKLEGRLKDFSERLNPTPPKQGIADRSAGLQSQVMRAVMGIVRAGIEPVNEPARVRYEKAKVKLEKFIQELNDFFSTEVTNYQKKLQEAGFSLLKSYQPIEIKK